ncbi:copper chaperone PCu(A)C, partial [Streptomyces sp. NPDC059524]|uniref:copper chaperone PCu(A)C n=1 Tax=Streptomyces sp. NPDC059524 TaxID=3346856 RepID=UPI00368871D0
MTRVRTPLAFGAVTLAAALALTACGSGDGDAPDVKVEGAFIPEPASGDMAAGFFVVHNGGAADTLESVSSEIAGQVTLHTTKDGVMKEQESGGGGRAGARGGGGGAAPPQPGRTKKDTEGGGAG